jgi:hypothetical protein
MAIQSPVSICGEDSSGFSEIVRSTAGAPHFVGDGGTGIGIQQNREVLIGTSTTRAAIEYPENIGPTSIDVRLYGTPGANVYCLICFNAQTDGQADGWLAMPADGNTDTKREFIYPESDYVGSSLATNFDPKKNDFHFELAYPLRRLDYKMNASGGAACHIVVKGVG